MGGNSSHHQPHHREVDDRRDKRQRRNATGNSYRKYQANRPRSQTEPIVKRDKNAKENRVPQHRKRAETFHTPNDKERLG